MRGPTLMMAFIAAIMLLCSCRSPRSDPGTGAKQEETLAPLPVPVAGTGTLQPASDPVDPLWNRTYVILPGDGVMFTGSTAGVAVWATKDHIKPHRTGGVVLPGSVSGLARLGPEGESIAACTGPTGVALVDASKAKNGELTVLHDGEWTASGGCHAAMDACQAGDGRLFVACGTSGVVEADVSDPSRPRVTRLAATGGYVRDLAILDIQAGRSTIVAAAIGLAGVAVLSFPPDGAPQVVGRLDTPGDARSLFLAGSTAYVADGPRGLLVVDLADPTAPVIRGAFDPETLDMTRGVLVEGSHAYLFVGNSGLVIVDVTDPASSKKTGDFVTDRAFNHAIIEGNLLYGANDDAGILVLDVSLASSPVQVFPEPG